MTSPEAGRRGGGHVVVLGAGPAGLWAAWRAAQAGHQVTVLEREARVGGLTASFELAGVRVDHGSHRLHRATDPAVLATLRGLLGDELQVRPRAGRIRLSGRWLGFPLTPAGIVTGLPPAFAARALADALLPSRRALPEGADPDTYDAVVRSRLGPTMADRFYGPYAVKMWGRPPDQLAAEQARRRIGASSPGALVRRVLAGRDPEARTFLYPRRGFGRIAEVLAEAATDAGASIRLSTTVTGVRPADRDRLASVTCDAGDHLDATAVLSTLPLPVLPRLVRAGGGDVPDGVLAAGGGLRARAMVLVYLVLPSPPWTRFDAHYLPESWTPVTRVSEPRRYREAPEDPDDVTVLCAEVPCDVGDATWTASTRTLRDVVTTTLERAGLPPAVVLDTHVVRVPSAYPVLDLAAPARQDVVEGWASALRGVRTLGRQGLFAHDNTHHAIAMAEAAVAATTPDGRLDPGPWAAAREGFRDHVVED
ncbi:MAG: FAD-dependent oxidoreductase [Actinomycetes bacterium]